MMHPFSLSDPNVPRVEEPCDRRARTGDRPGGGDADRAAVYTAVRDFAGSGSVPGAGRTTPMKVLVSPVSVAEALEVAAGDADIVDIKNVREGSLGASFPWIIREVIASLRGRDVIVSATLGDLPYTPGTASLAALGAAACGARYVKAGLYGVRGYEEALDLMRAVARACKEYDPETIVVAAGYADYRRFGGIDARTVVRVGCEAGADIVMLDTAIKDGKTLFDALTMEEIEDFIGAAHAGGLRVAVAGSVRLEHLVALRRLGPDVVGVRGGVCSTGDRTTRIEAARVRAFVEAARGPSRM
jgi:uncharacterized protein (UPF0264 family)